MTSSGPCASNAGPLIHLAKINKLYLLKEIFGAALIPDQVRVEVVERGLQIGAADALTIEHGIQDGWIKTQKVDIANYLKKVAERAGIENAEAATIQLAYNAKLPMVADDAGARAIAKSLGLEVTGSIGIIIRAAKEGIISKNDALRELNLLSTVIWMGVDIYRRARESIETL